MPYKISHFVARIFFRGIYFPPKGVYQWLKLIAQNRASVYRLVRESFTQWHGADGAARHSDFNAGPQLRSATAPPPKPARKWRSKACSVSAATEAAQSTTMVKTMKLLPVLLFTATLCAQTWTPQTSNTRASLRGVSAVDARTVFASGSGGTWLVTTDGGVTWRAAKVPGAEALDFRGIHAIDARTVYLMSAGPGDKSRIYKTSDAGEHWTLLFTNPDPKGFFDAIAFWDAQHGIVVGDQLDGHAEVLVTDDGGATWQHRTPPPGLPNEGSFAASNTCLTLFGRNDAWFATGGPGAARVFHSDGSRPHLDRRHHADSQRWRRRRHLLPRLRRCAPRHRGRRRLFQGQGRPPEHRAHFRRRPHLVCSAGRRPQRLPFRRRLATRPQALDRHRHLRVRRLELTAARPGASSTAAPTTP